MSNGRDRAFELGVEAGTEILMLREKTVELERTIRDLQHRQHRFAGSEAWIIEVKELHLGTLTALLDNVALFMSMVDVSALKEDQVRTLVTAISKQLQNTKERMAALHPQLNEKLQKKIAEAAEKERVAAEKAKAKVEAAVEAIEEPVLLPSLNTVEPLDAIHKPYATGEFNIDGIMGRKKPQ